MCNPRVGFVGGQCETNELFLHSAHSLPSSFPFITYSPSLALHRSFVIARQDLSVERDGKVFLLSAHSLRSSYDSIAVSVFVVIFVDFDKYLPHSSLNLRRAGLSSRYCPSPLAVLFVNLKEKNICGWNFLRWSFFPFF